MSLSANRSRRSNAGNRWAEALAAAQLENGDAPDPDAEGSGEEFVGKEEEDIFASDFESTDEEEYAKQGVEDGEKQVLMAERAERRAARNKASKSVAAPVQRILDRAMRGEPMPKRRKVETKKPGESGPKAKRSAGAVGWDATRQSERALTVKHKALVQERLKDAAKKKAYAPRRPRQVAPPKTQDELIAAALELEEKNTKSLKEFLVKEEEKRAAARRVVRMKIDGPKLRWVSREEQVRIKLVDEGATEGSGSATKSPGSIVATAQDGLPPQNQLAPSTSDIPSQPVTPSQPSGAPEPSMQNQLPSSSTTQPPGSGELDTRQALPTIAETCHTPTPSRRSSTPARQRMQVYVELPRPKHHSSPTSGSTGRASSLASSSQKLAVPSSQPLTRSPLSTSHPLPRSPLSTSQPLLPSPSQPTPTLPPSMSRSASAQEHTTARQTTSPVNALQPPNLDALRRPNAIRQGSVSSSSSSKSKMIMYVELPAPRKKSKTPVPRDTSSNVAAGLDGNCEPNANMDSKEPNIPAVATEPVVTSEPLVKQAVPSRSKDSDLFPPGGPNFAIVLPTRKPTHKTERYMRNYVIADLGERRPPFEKSMQTIFGDHANWQDAIINGVKPRTQAKPICAITGLAAPYRDPRTGIPYANAYAYKTLMRLLAHEFVWSKEKGCYVGDEGQNPARGVPSNWGSAAAGRF